MTSKKLLVAGCVLITLMLSGCNTVAGVGQDLQGGGKSLEHSAKKTHQDIKNNN